MARPGRRPGRWPRSTTPGADEPSWSITGLETYDADPTPGVRARYAEVRDLTANQL